MSKANATLFLRPGIRTPQDFVLVGPSESYVDWNTSFDPVPTQQEIDDALSDTTVVNGQTFSQWLAEHGGDAVLTLRREARESVDAADPESLARRAYALAVRADPTGTKTERQLRDDAKARIDAGEVG